MASLKPTAVRKVRGRVEQGNYGAGTKSERNTVFLQTQTMRYILRRKTGPAIGDTHLDSFVGLDVECDGFIVGTTLLADRIQVLGSAK